VYDTKMSDALNVRIRLSEQKRLESSAEGCGYRIHYIVRSVCELGVHVLYIWYRFWYIGEIP